MSAQSPEEICRLFQQHMAAGELDALLNLYDAEAAFLTQSGAIKRGHQELREVLAPLAATRPRFEYVIRQIIQSGDIALMHTDWRIVAPQPEFQFALEVARRQPDGTWRWLIGDPFTISQRIADGKE